VAPHICCFCVYVAPPREWKNGILAYFLQILPQLKSFSKNLSVRFIFVLDATFVPNLMFLCLLNPEIWFGEKPTQLDIQLILPSVNKVRAVSHFMQTLMV